MWLLRNDSKGLVYKVAPGKQHSVGRRGGDLVLHDDQSISRKHAEFQIDEENGANGIVVKDLDSKYGTFVANAGGEWVQLSPNQQSKLISGDSVKFGSQWNCWRVEYTHLLVATSTLTNEEKSNVKQMVEGLGGFVVSEWQANCTHLTMNKLTVTIKVVCALACGHPIVTPSFWSSFSQSVSTMQSPLPDCKDFLPPLAEAMLNPAEVSFAPNASRRTLFQGYTFVAASTKQLSRIRPMITAAGGNAVEFSAKTWTEDRFTESDKTILMLSSVNERQGSQQSQVFDGYIPLARKLRSKGIRCIPESEIGLSVVHCSLTQFCNPRFSNQSLIKSPTTQATQQVTVICPNTEESMEIERNSIDTILGPNAQSATKKRVLEDFNRNEEPINKRPDLKKNSEDLFDSQLNNSRTNILSKSSLKKTDCSSKSSADYPVLKTNPAPSLDMFAPSTDRSSTTKWSLKKADCSNKSSPDNPVKINAVPSLDMFAPSAERSCPVNAHNQGAVDKSCEDIFASASSTSHLHKEGSSDNASFQQRMGVNVPPSKEEEDVFSFVSTKNPRKSQTKADNPVDNFSFKPNKTTFQAEDEDAFSFSSVKRPNKRNRQSNPDMFASSAESSFNSSFVKVSKNRDDINFKSSKHTGFEDNLFAFPDDHNPKRRKTGDQVLDLNNVGSEVKIALLTNGGEPEPGPSRHLRQEVCEYLPEQKDLVVYSKFDCTNKKVKQEIVDEEIDELARELLNATVVVVKPLLIAREAPPQCSAVHTGKNFKKFRKVVGINKRIVPHIIGGSDLVPHYNIGQDSRDKDLASVLNIPLENEDEWTFNQNKKQKNNYQVYT